MDTDAEKADGGTSQRTAAVAVLLWPLVITAAGVLLYLGFMDHLPDRVATHWSREGPDGFTARESVPWFGLLALAIAWVSGGVVLAAGAGRDATHRQLAVGFTAGLAAFMVGVMVGTAWVQRGLRDGSAAREVEWPLTVALLVSVAVGVVAGVALPGRAAGSATSTGQVPADAPRPALTVGRSVWQRYALPTPGVWAGVGVLGAVGVGTVALTRMWVFGLLLLVLTVGAMLAFTAFRVTVGDSGVSVRSIIGRPRWRMPLNEVAQARVTTVNPLTEFGGWGYRLGVDGRTGFVVRAGEALEVVRSDGRSWVVTVDDAAQGAALLNTLVDRARR